MSPTPPASLPHPVCPLFTILPPHSVPGDPWVLLGDPWACPTGQWSSARASEGLWVGAVGRPRPDAWGAGQQVSFSEVSTEG